MPRFRAWARSWNASAAPNSRQAPAAIIGCQRPTTIAPRTMNPRPAGMPGGEEGTAPKRPRRPGDPGHRAAEQDRGIADAGDRQPGRIDCQWEVAAGPDREPPRRPEQDEGRDDREEVGHETDEGLLEQDRG